jgi:hypothetical protein
VSLFLRVSLILSILLALDGAVCLLFRKRVEGWIREIFPGVNVFWFAFAELVGGVLSALLLLRYGADV